MPNRHLSVVGLLAVLCVRPARGGCCQESTGLTSAVTYNMVTCEREEYEYIQENKFNPAADPYSPAACRSRNPGCCTLGPPGACNWRRDCCNMGTGSGCPFLYCIDLGVWRVPLQSSAQSLLTSREWNWQTGGVWINHAEYDVSTGRCEIYEWSTSEWSPCPPCGEDPVSHAECPLIIIILPDILCGQDSATSRGR